MKEYYEIKVRVYPPTDRGGEMFGKIVCKNWKGIDECLQCKILHYMMDNKQTEGGKGR